MATDAGAPSAEDKARYDAARKELMLALGKKRAVDKQLAQLEWQIYNFEGSYLSETIAHSGGNIIQGFDAYMKNQTTGRKKHEVSEQDRMFSNSSLTYQKSLDLVGEGEGDDSAADESTSTMQIAKGLTPGLTTVVLPPASRTQELTAAQQKKARDKEYQRRKRANASQRSTVSGEDDSDVLVSRRPTKRARLADDD